MDLLYIVPYITSILSIDVGQRYDVIFNATETPGTDLDASNLSH